MEFENLLILIKTVSDSELTDFAYEENGTSIHLKKKKETVVVAGNQPDVPIAGKPAVRSFMLARITMQHRSPAKRRNSSVITQNLRIP